MNTLEKFASLIKKYEGWYPFSRSWRNKNPGNLRWSPFQAGQRGGFSYFKTYEDGWKALLYDIKCKWTGKTRTGLGPNSTILDFFKVYAPSRDSNNPLRYAQFVAKGLGVSIYTRLGELLERYKKEVRKEKEASDTVLYCVKRGDTLSSIAQQYGLHWRDIYNANRDKIKDPNLIYPGQVFVIPQKGFAGEIWYTVKKGDTLSKIAKKYHTSWKRIYELNRSRISDPNLIFPGQKLLIKK